MCASLRRFALRLLEAWAPRVNRAGEDGGATSLVGGRLSRSVEAKGKGKEEEAAAAPESRPRQDLAVRYPPIASHALR